jgi:hypothetical protein
MDSLITVGVGAGGAALGSLVTGYLLKAADRRGVLRDAGPLEVKRKEHLDRYEAVKSLSGQLANLKHYVDHVCKDKNADSRRAYRKKGEALSREIRGQARSEIYGFGPEVLPAIYEITDKAQAILAVGRGADPRDAYAAETRSSMRHEWVNEIDALSMRLSKAARAHEQKWRG